MKRPEADLIQTIVECMLLKNGRTTQSHRDEFVSIEGTGERWFKAFQEMTVGYGHDQKQILAKRFPSTYDELVLVTGIQFNSLCEHHLLPFSGVAHVAYLPGENVVGLSKLARLVECFALRIQIQERMTLQIAGAVMEELHPRGAACIVEATHSCMACRGVRKAATMTTSTMLGMFRENSDLRAEMLSMIRR